MDRPQRKTFRPAYHWHDVQNYVEAKYGIEFRGYKRKVDGEYRDFWRFIVEKCGPHRGSFIFLPEDTGGAEPWQLEILNLILAEFPELASERVWVDW